MGFLAYLGILVGAFAVAANAAFNSYYTPLWGFNHITVDPRGNQVQLLMDKSSGAGFKSKLDYGSGLFRIKMKIPQKKTGGIVTSFFLTSAPVNQPPGNHFEIDYEFLGTNGTVQTNVYNNDQGHREQSFRLWFDPSKDFHTYEFLWNSRQIVFIIDGIPIRVFKNLKARGLAYPDRAMHIEASIWNANWAGAVDWSQAPFIASYADFAFNACPARNGDVRVRASPGFFWNKQGYWELNNAQKQKMNQYRRSYMIYDYCSNPSTRKPECSLNA